MVDWLRQQPSNADTIPHFVGDAGNMTWSLSPVLHAYCFHASSPFIIVFTESSRHIEKR